MAIAEFTVVPMDKGESLSEYIAPVMDLVDKSGLDYRFTPMATIVEGDYDAIMELVGKCHKKMREVSKRVITTVKVDEREGVSGQISQKVKSVESSLGRELRKE